MTVLIVVSFASFTLYGILRAPSNPDVFEIESVTWNMTRPFEEGLFIVLNENVSNSYISDAAAVSLELVVVYFEARRISEYDGLKITVAYENLWITLNASVIINNGFVHSMVVKFSTDLRNSSLDINEDSDRFVFRNIEKHEIVDNKEQSYIEAQAEGKPRSCVIENYFTWSFYDLNILDHELAVTLEVTYFNGTAYRRAVIPTGLTALSSPGH